jgi:phosphohistidine phosphatase SixA
MMRIYRLLSLLACLLLPACVTAPAASQAADPAAATSPAPASLTTTVIVVRHAEKVDDSSDPPLSEAGQARATALAAALADAGVSAIYTTQFERTRATAAPLARALGLSPTVIQGGGPAAAHARAVASRVLSQSAGRTSLVVGHSNTVPDIVQALGAADVGTIADDEYHNLFIVQVGSDAVRLIRGRY